MARHGLRLASGALSAYNGYEDMAGQTLRFREIEPIGRIA